MSYEKTAEPSPYDEASVVLLPTVLTRLRQSIDFGYRGVVGASCQ